MFDSPEINEQDIFYFLDSEIRGLREVSLRSIDSYQIISVRNQLLALPKGDALKLLQVMENLVEKSQGSAKSEDEVRAEKEKTEEKALLDATLYQRKMRQQPAVQDLAVAKPQKFKHRNY